MEPFFFGAPGRKLLGLYHPATGIQKPEGAVICAPFFAEYLRSHSCLRKLALALADKGLHVLRFDYYGTGDSEGTFDATVPTDWQSDVGTAIAELTAIAGVRRVCLIGVRLGATLAARAALETPAVDRVLLWDPIVDGSAYVRQLHDTHTRLLSTHGRRTRTSHTKPIEQADELIGSPVSRRTIEGIAELALPAWSQLRGSESSSFVVLGGNGAGYESMIADAEAAAVRVSRVDFDCDWSSYTEAVLFPHDIVNALVAEA